MESILIIMQNLGGGGAEKVLVNMLRHIDYTRVKLTLLLLNGGGVHDDKVPPEVELIHLDKHPTPHRDRFFHHCKWLKQIYFNRRLRRLMQGRRFDATVSYLEGQAMFAHSHLMDLSKRNITFVHSDRSKFIYSYKYFVSPQHESDVYDRMDAICFVCEDGKKGFISQTGITDNLHVVYNTVDPQEIAEKSRALNIPRSDKFTLVSVGRLDKVKRQEVLLHMCAWLKSRGHDFELWLLGAGEREAELKELASQLDLGDTVKFMGFQTNPYAYIKAADLFVLSSESESFPTVVSEALCLGKPVVSTRVAGIDEQLGGVAGIVTEHDALSLANAVERVMTDRTLYDSLREGAKSRSDLFNPAHAAKCFMSVALQNHQISH